MTRHHTFVEAVRRLPALTLISLWLGVLALMAIGALFALVAD